MKIKLLFALFVASTLVGCTPHQTKQQTRQQTIQQTHQQTSQQTHQQTSHPQTTSTVAANLSTLTAEFTTLIYGKGNDTKTQWHLWRSPARVEWLNIQI